jgi:hypothetical protein
MLATISVGDGTRQGRGALKPDSIMVARLRDCGVALTVLLFATACERSGPPDVRPPEPDLHGASLVVGSSVDQWSLLSVPQGGGLAEARALSDLSRIVWTGTTELPPAVEAHALSGGSVVLRTAEGVVHTYDPPSDVLVRVGEVGTDATWFGDGAVGLYLSPRGSLLEISADGVWLYGLEREVAWAAPAEGGVLVALEDDRERRALWLLQRDQDEPVETGDAAVRSPGVVTAWGRRAVLTSSDGRGLAVLTVAPIEPAGDVDLGGPIRTISTSPSTHEIYVGLDDPPRLVAVNRFNLSSRAVAELSTAPGEVRPTLFGEGILVEQGDQVVRVPVGGGSPTRLDSGWRPDLPLGLPGSRVVTVRNEDVFVADLQDGREALLEGARPDHWWLPLHWNPVQTVVTADRVTGEVVPGEVREPDREAPDAGVDSAELAERMAAAPGLRDRAAPRAATGPPPGFYAIVGSARQPGGIRSLVQSLEDAGFATQTQSFPDEAGRTWYRGLVGPYRSRSEAEAAARQLLRERRLEAWVTEVGAGGRLDEEPI